MYFSHRVGNGLEFNRDSDRGNWIGSVRRNEVEGNPKVIFEDQVPSMGFGMMKNLLTKTDEEILLELVNSYKGFKEELDVTQISAQTFGLALLLLDKAFATNAFPKALAQLVIMVRGTNWFAQLPIFVQSIKDFNKENVEYLEKMLHVLKIFLTKIPSSLGLVNQVLLTLKYMVKVRDIPPSIKPDLEAQIDDLQRCTDEMEKRDEKQKIANNFIEEDFLKPPENFLEISILPSADDLVRDEKPFIRMNKSHGRYQDLAHYLDVQFRLLRADFVGPLQNGIQTYLQSQDRGRHQEGPTQDIHMYENIRLIGPVCHRNGVAYKIQFDTTRLGNVQWQNSKRFIFGSLVCLSVDNFESMFLGIVANRDLKELSEGKIDIYVEGNHEAFLHLDYSDSMVMVESIAYFEAYRHVLLGLKTLLNSGLAMSSYIIECDMKPKPPSYLQGNSTCYDMRCLIAKSKSSSQWSQIPVLQREMWPSADDFGLDSAQYEALHSALTHEFALIQGPPGTGKTFIGLKIAEVLLKNSYDISNIGEKPMMVVCYTNHALDQFLEGIHKFIPNGILRIGGGCNSKTLENCKLHNVRKEYKLMLKLVGKYSGRAAFFLHVTMERCEAVIQECTTFIERLNKRIPFTHLLSGIMSDNHMDQIMSIPVQNKYAVMEWLGHGPNMPFDSPVEKDQEHQDMEDVHEEEDEPIDIMHQLDAEDIHQVDIEDLSDGRRMSRDERKAIFKTMALHHLGIKHEYVDDMSNTDVWKISKAEKKNRKKNICRRLANVNAMSEEEANAVIDVRQLSVHERWRLYHFWLKKFRRGLRQKTQHMATEYHDAVQRLQEINDHNNLQVMKRMKVIGMTTTGAARYQHIIQQLAPPIVIIEEAAEVLEAHVVTALNPGCKHLILIGDHKQLRPSPTVYELACKYHLDLSLFERMINNGLDFVTLSRQHRMRPEISLLVKPIYPELTNHDSVLSYPAVKGVKHNMFLIDHQQNETHSEELLSKMNHHEAKYISRLCLYLLQQGYKPEQITVLTPYSGQMLLIKREMAKDTFSGVYICVLDSYQGEENEIILLSLVRSNREGKLGFLGVENRICVALSRAKLGLYIIGDFTMFGGSAIWANILKLVGEHRGPGLPLSCPNHPQNKGIYAVTDKDFDQVPEGGCKLPCEYRLPCGHTCPLICHGYDPQHWNVKCTKPCPTIFLPCQHKCPNLCHDCGECPILVKKNVPECKILPQHEILVACSADLAGVACEDACEKILDCGHRCQKLCHQECGDCCVRVKKSIPQCNNIPKHKIWVACSTALDGGAPCEVTCEKILDCGHRCQKLCRQECGDCRVRVKKSIPQCNNIPKHKIWVACSNALDGGAPCEVTCEKILDCGHRCQKLCRQECGDCRVEVKKSIPQCNNTPKHQIPVACSENVLGDSCPAPCEYILPCGHGCIAKCGSSHRCVDEEVKRLTCGHTIDVKCIAQVAEASLTCTATCDHPMLCGHPCEGDCMKCLRGRMHVGCRQRCRRTLVCNHRCRALCGVCPSCPRQCESRCAHRKCHKRCGVPCIPCTEPCAWVCEHYQCTRPCHAPCNRPPCNKRCDKMLQCGHQCVGICGETCPPLCRNCDREKLYTSHFGPEAQEDALFVYLEDCGHVVEVTAMDKWVDDICRNFKDTTLQPLVCPRCETAILKNLRYGKRVNAWCSDVQVAKQRALEEHSTLFRKVRKIPVHFCAIIGIQLAPRWQHRIKVMRDPVSGSLSSPSSTLVMNESQSSKECADLLTLLNALKSITRLKAKVRVKLRHSTNGHIILRQLESLFHWLNTYSRRFHPEVTHQLDAEWQRLNLFIKVGQHCLP